MTALPRWGACLIGALICVLIAWLFAPLIPEPFGHIVAVLAWVGAAVLLIVAVFLLVAGGTSRRL